LQQVDSQNGTVLQRRTLQNSRFLFELGMKESKGIKDANTLFVAPNQAFASLIPLDSFIPNSNEKRLLTEPFRFITH
jgi:hypothetical protein